MAGWRIKGSCPAPVDRNRCAHVSCSPPAVTSLPRQSRLFQAKAWEELYARFNTCSEFWFHGELVIAALPSLRVRLPADRDRRQADLILGESGGLGCCPSRQRRCDAGPIIWCASPESRGKSGGNFRRTFRTASLARDSRAPAEIGIPAQRLLALCGSRGRHPDRCRNQRSVVQFQLAGLQESSRVSRWSNKR